MSATMVDLAQTSKDPLLAGVAEMFLMYSDPMKYMTYETIGDLRVAQTLMATLPTWAYRAINGAYTEGTGTFETLEEDLSIIGHDIDIDLELEGNRTQMVPMEATQVKGAMKSLSYRINNDLVNGDAATNPLAVDGLTVRVGNLAARQRIAADAAAPTTDLPVFASAENQNQAMERIDEAISVLDGGQCDLILMDETSLRGLYALVRRVGGTAGMIDYRDFMLGSGVQAVASLKLGPRNINIALTGFTDETQATRVIPLTMDPGDGGNDATAMFFVRLGKEYFTGIQKRALRTKKFDELEVGPQKRIRLDWPYGYSNWNDRSISRILGLRWQAS